MGYRRYAVITSNEMNKIELGKLSAREADLFATVCAYVKNRGTHRVKMTFDQIRQMSGYTERNNQRMIEELVTLNRKLMNLYYEFEDERSLQGFTLFQWWEISKDPTTWEIAVSEKFEFMLNRMSGEFTRYELDEFTTVDGKYSKALYRLLKQFRSTGLYCVHVEDFRQLLDVPKKYPLDKIDDRIISPAIEELKDYFEELAVKKTYKAGRGRGGKVVVGYEFTFKKNIDADQKTAENAADELRRLIAETELKILSTKKAMDKKANEGNWKDYEAHKKKNIYFHEKLDRLKLNLDAFAPEQLEIDGVQKG